MEDDQCDVILKPDCEQPDKREILKAKLVYVFYYGAAASLTAYLPVFYKQLNMDDTETGILASLKPFVTFISAPLWGGISDRTGRHKTVMLVAVALYTLLILAIYPFSLTNHANAMQSNATSNSSFNFTEKMTDCVTVMDCVTGVTNSNHSSSPISSSSELSNQTKFWLLFVMTSVAFFFMATISPIMDATVVTMSTDVDYGKLRLWGAFGFGLFGFLSGFAANEGNLEVDVNEKANFLWSFVIFLVLNVSVFVVCLTMKGVEGRKPSNILLPHLKVIFTNPRVLLFIIVLLIMGISSGVITWLLFIFLKDLGGSHTLMGMSIAVYCTSEVIVFLISGKMIKLLGTNKILFLSLAVFIIRLVAYSYLQNPWLVLLIEPLHGLTYAALWASCVSYATVISPPEVTTTVIGIMTGVHFGLGWGLGGSVGGVVYQYYGPRVLFRACAVMCGIGMALHAVAEVFFGHLAQ